MRYAWRAPKSSEWSLSPQVPTTRGYGPTLAIAPTGALLALSAVRGGTLIETAHCTVPAAVAAR